MAGVFGDTMGVCHRTHPTLTETTRETMAKRSKRKRRKQRIKNMPDAMCLDVFGLTHEELEAQVGCHPAVAWEWSFPSREKSIALLYREAMGLDIGHEGQLELEDIARKHREESLAAASAEIDAELARFEEFYPTPDIEDDEPAQGGTAPTTEKGKHGGAREGAGRKSRGKSAAKFTRSTRLTREELARFEENLDDGESWADYLRRLLRQDAKVQELRRKQRGEA